MPDMREEFEARYPLPEGIEWRETDYFPVKTDSASLYVALAGIAAIHSARWQAWLASRAALRVELPDRLEHESDGSDYSDGRVDGYNDCLSDMTEALQQAGIEVE